MKTCFRIFPSLLGALLMLSGSAHAEYIYTYTGYYFDPLGILAHPGGGTVVPNTGVYTTSDYIRGTFRIADAVFRDTSPTTYDASMVLAYSFTDGHQTLTDANSTVVAFGLFQDVCSGCWPHNSYTNSWGGSSTSPTPTGRCARDTTVKSPIMGSARM